MHIIVQRFSVHMLSLMAVSCMLFFSHGVQAASYTVSKLNDTADGVCDADCSLREAVIEANTNGTDDTITLLAGTYTLSIINTSGDEEAAAEGDLDVLSAGGTLTITGAGMYSTVIDANTIDRIFEIASSATLTLSDMSVQNGSVSSSTTSARGGALYMGNLTTATFSRVLFSGNTIESSSVGADMADGGAVYISNATVSIEDSVFQNNTATRSVTGNGGASRGGAIYFESGSLTVSNSLFYQNALVSEDSHPALGAAIGNGNSSATPSSFTNTQFIANTITAATGLAVGGAIYTNSPTSIAFSTFADNTITGSSTQRGGAIYTEGTIEVLATIFSQNLVSGSDSSCYLVGSTSTSLGYNIDSGATCIQDGVVSGDWKGFDNDDSTDFPSTNALLSTAGLVDNGGNVLTIALQDTSPAKDIVPAVDCLDASESSLGTDARSYVRPENTNCDAGAYELDQTDPIVTVTGISPVSLECAATYSDEGAEAVDNWDGSLVVSTDASDVDTSVLGAHTVLYTSTDTDGNIGTNSRTVNITDSVDPAVVLNGDSSVTVVEGAVYTELGSLATDACEGSLAVMLTGAVNTAVPGVYSLTYTATDSSDNSDSDIRTVTVLADSDADGVPVTTDSNDNDYDNDGVSTSDDCDDADADLSIEIIYYADTDTDGLGDIENSLAACSLEAPTGYVSNSTDEDDSGVDEIEENEEEATLASTVGTLYPNVADLNNTLLFSSIIASVAGNSEGYITITYTDSSTQHIPVFTSYTASDLTTVKQYGDTGYLIVLHPKGKKIALVNPYTGEIIQRIRLSKKIKYVKNSLKVLDVRHDGTFDIVVTSKKKSKVKLSLLKLNVSAQHLSLKDQENLHGASAVVNKTKAPKKKIVIKNVSGRILYTLRVGKKYKISVE